MFARSTCAWRLTGLVVIGVLFVMAVHAATPTTMSYQGRLTDVGGAPVADGSYSVTFAIYGLPSGGGALWSEAQSITTSGGLFATHLGIFNPLQDVLFSDTGRYLGITVGADPEITPRTKLNTSPYAYRVATVDGSTGGFITGPVRVWNPGSGQVEIADVGGQGEGIYLYQEDFFPYMGLEPDADGVGGFFRLWGGNFSSGLYIDGYATPGGDAAMAFYGTQSLTILNSGEAGNLSVQLPTDAVGSFETLDEPGLASSFNAGSVILNGLMQDLAVTTITIPAPGYIFVVGRVPEIDADVSTGIYNAIIQIDETAGGGVDAQHYAAAGFNGAATTGVSILSVEVDRIYYKASAGSYTFRLEGLTTGTGQATAYFSRVHAIYIPTSYGSVAAAPAMDVTAQVGDGASKTTAAGVTVTPVEMIDLRELELEVARKEAEAQKARAALAEAAIKKQLEARQVEAPLDGEK